MALIIFSTENKKTLHFKMMSDYEINQIDDSSVDASYIAANKLHNGCFIMIEGHPSKIVDIKVTKDGKHGHAKATIMGMDVFSGKKRMTCISATHEVMVPNVKRSELQLINIDGDMLQLLDKNGNMNESFSLENEDEDMKDKLHELAEDGNDIILSIIHYGTESKILGYKSN
ncbi:Eukaryotic translation initiation factor 5A-1 [Tritrichomonas foetus]|uniref:Eukaryotic translation initiation factor 5A n=1 Tax=Tritrichomonas foetus TaxID=1144522 RepID=A0A1J4JKL8_9EUKA|nr:Eukaryotic translation initiation factor 5A-1 [Tritrichomonas foetus]|eukprot:OHS99185.1 Eukaryotic translation initiation factor 5A-1 [Tritrichomonas foetus]